MLRKRAFYLHCPAGDIGHPVHLLRLLSALERAGRGRNLIFLRSPSIYPLSCFSRFGEVVRLRGVPSAASGRRVADRLAAFGPGVFVTEFYPLGRAECRSELEPALAAARAAGCRLVSSVPMPYFTAPAAELPALLASCLRYDRILVHSPAGADLTYMAKAVGLERRVSPAAFSAFFRSLGRRAVFTGYLMPGSLPARRRGCYVLAARGGGSTSAALIEASIGSAVLTGLPLVAVAGPASGAVEMRRFRRLAAAAGPGVRLLRESRDLPALIAGASACVSTAGGSVYEMLALRKPMVLAPYCGARLHEHSDQLARAWLMRDAAGAELLLPAAVTPAGVAAALRRVMAAPQRTSPSVKHSWFAGARRSAEVICAL